MILIKKAFKVWHDGMISDNPCKGYRIDDLPVIYAETPSQAKSNSTDVYDWTIFDREPVYIDLKVKRVADMDLMLFEDREIRRIDALMILRKRRDTERRRRAVERFSEESEFYIQNGYVGNSVLWWGEGCAGYTTDINKAHKFSKKEVLERFVGGRDEDIIWEKGHVLENVRSHVDAQYLSNYFKC